MSRTEKNDRGSGAQEDRVREELKIAQKVRQLHRSRTQDEGKNRAGDHYCSSNSTLRVVRSLQHPCGVYAKH